MVHDRARAFDAVAEVYEQGRPGWPPDRLDAALADIRGVLDHHGVRTADLTFRTEITTVRR